MYIDFSRQCNRGINSCVIGQLDLARWASSLPPITIQSISYNAEVIQINMRFYLMHGHFKSTRNQFLHQIFSQAAADHVALYALYYSWDLSSFAPSFLLYLLLMRSVRRNRTRVTKISWYAMVISSRQSSLVKAIFIWWNISL